MPLKKVLLISRDDAFNIKNIIDLIIRNFDATIIVDKRNNKFPDKYSDWSGDYIFAYLCPWVLPNSLIKKAKIAAINFHPGPPSYPGTGCYNFAIYNEEKKYGVTCHHLAKKVDTGKIISVINFPLLKNDRVVDLINRTYIYLNMLFFELVLDIIEDKSLPDSDYEWRRKPYTKKELDELSMLSRKMDSVEIEKRIRATTYNDKFGPYYID